MAAARMAAISPARALADISVGDASSMFFGDGSEELQPSEIVSLIVRSGWQIRVIGGKISR